MLHASEDSRSGWLEVFEYLERSQAEDSLDRDAACSTAVKFAEQMVTPGLYLSMKVKGGGGGRTAKQFASLLGLALHRPLFNATPSWFVVRPSSLVQAQ